LKNSIKKMLIQHLKFILLILE